MHQRLLDISKLLLARHSCPIDALHALWQAESQNPNLPFFAVFATLFYKQHFISYTPHLWDFKQAAQLQSHSLEEQIITRISF